MPKGKHRSRIRGAPHAEHDLERRLASEIGLQEIVSEEFGVKYNPKTGVFTWLRTTRVTRQGAAAGSHNNKGYWILRSRGRYFKAHRVAWYLYYGQWPDKDIDHINGVKDDNSIGNLRLASSLQNKFNVGLRSDNKSGRKGVYWDSTRKKWVAQIRMHKKIKKLGSFETVDEAHEAYVAVAKAYQGEFARIE